jgi:hypothetical protein
MWLLEDGLRKKLEMLVVRSSCECAVEQGFEDVDDVEGKC